MVDDVEKNPAVKLLEFFEGMRGGVEIGLETGGSVARSEALGKLAAVRPVWMGVWLRQWGF